MYSWDSSLNYLLTIDAQYLDRMKLNVTTHNDIVIFQSVLVSSKLITRIVSISSKKVNFYTRFRRPVKYLAAYDN